MKLLERLPAAARRAGAAARRVGTGARGLVPDALMIAGAASISYAAWLLHPSAGFFVGGCFSLAAGWLGASGGRE